MQSSGGGSRRNNNNSNSNNNRPYQLKSNKRVPVDESLPQHQIMEQEYETALDLESNFVNSGSRNGIDQSFLLLNNTNNNSAKDVTNANCAVDKNIISPPTPSKKRKVYTDVVNPLSDRYENVFCVRRGDYSCIYFVQDKVTKQDLSVKEVTASQARKEYEFAKELNSIPNPNIMKYTFIPPNLLESIWCQNGSYDQYAQRVLNNAPPSYLTMLHHFRDLASGAAHIELRRFVHLDLKPANILVSQPRAGSDVPLLIIGDFGSMVEVGTLIDDDQEGDGKYIAPEVFKPNYQASTKFDIFSLALCIIEIATGEQMSNDKWNQFKQEKIQLKQFENMSEKVFGLLPRMLSLDPSLRPDATTILPILQKQLLVSLQPDMKIS